MTAPIEFETLAEVLERRELSKLETQIDEKLDQIVECSSLTVQRAFERKVEKLERDKLLIEEKLSQKPGPKRGFEEMFELAMQFLANPWKLWASDRIEDKRTVLKLTFSERLAYSRNSGFRTPKTTTPFNTLGGNQMQLCKMAETKSAIPTSSTFQSHFKFSDLASFQFL